jgi:hypothetical protein
MANKSLSNVVIQLNYKTAAQWTSSNPTLGAGEIGIESDTGKAKMGNGVNFWTALPYTWVTPSEIAAFGGGDMVSSLYATNPDASAGYVDKSKKSQQLETSHAIALSGDVTGSVCFDGSSDVTLTTTLKNSGATEGTYTKVTISAKGIVTSAASLAASDIPTLALSKLSDAGTAAALNTGTNVGNVVVVESNGFINEAILPPVSIVDVLEADTIDDMLELDAQKGDFCIVDLEDGAEVYLLAGDDPSVQASWKRINLPTGAVLTVNGLTGVVTLTTTNIAEGSNLYYTETRATANFTSNFACSLSTGLYDSATLLRDSDTLTLVGRYS